MSFGIKSQNLKQSDSEKPFYRAFNFTSFCFLHLIDINFLLLQKLSLRKASNICCFLFNQNGVALRQQNTIPFFRKKSSNVFVEILDKGVKLVLGKIPQRLHRYLTWFLSYQRSSSVDGGNIRPSANDGLNDI